MPTASTLSARFVAFGLFIVLTVLLSIGGSHLPNGAGPDEGHSLNAINFYQAHKRLAVFPKDNDNVHFSTYGSTRVIRPPFPYVLAAITASMNIPSAVAYGGYRYASSIALALSISIIFWSLYKFKFRAGIAFLATILICTLPQYLFHGVYMGDDAGAFVAAALQMGCALHLIKHGITPKWLIATSAVIGFTFINKITGWIGLPALFLLFLLNLRNGLNYSELKPVSTLLWMTFAFFICGGFWIVHNLINYGADPFLMRLNGELAREFARLEAPHDQGYLARFNMSYLDVITNRQFLFGSFRAFVGNLDLLRLPVGPVAYIWFLLILIITFVSYVISIRNYPKLAIYALCWISMQLFMYVHFNVAEDIQIQGKYLLPLVPLIAFYLALALDRIHLQNKANERFILFYIFFASCSVALITFCLRIYPFYKPNPVDFYTENAIDIFSHPKNIITTENLEIEHGSTVTITAIGGDPKIFLSSSTCENFGRNFIVRARFTAKSDDHLRIFIDNGKGYRGANSFAYHYGSGKQKIWLPVSAQSCKGIRLDPVTSANGVLTDFSLEFIPYSARIKRSP